MEAQIENTTKVLFYMPKELHKPIKIESIIREKKIHEIIIERLSRDLEKHPISNFKTK
jgi:hypothetical protein